MKKIVSFALATLILLVFTACGNPTVSGDADSGSSTIEKTKESKDKVDYENEVVFEKALNNGVDVTGKTVKFTADELHPESMVGYNIWSGEHLNFISEKDPGIEQGQIVTAKIINYTTELGSWYLTYKVIKKTNGASEKVEKQDIILKDSGYTVVSGTYDTTVFYAVEIENPNEDYAIKYPEINIVCKSDTGAILEVEEQTLNYIAAGDTLTYANSFSCDTAEPETVEITVTNSKDHFEVQSDKYLKVSDFVPYNISVFGNGEKTTAEIKNTSAKDVEAVTVSVVLLRDNHVVGGYSEYVGNLPAGSSRPVEASEYDAKNIAYDTVQVHVCEW